MVYTPTAWANGSAPAINAANLGKIEAELVALDAAIGSPGISDGITPESYGAVGDGVANDTVPMQNALAAASASSRKTPVVLSGLYRTTSALTPFTGMRMVARGRGSEFGRGAMIRNQVSDMFTPAADISDIHLEGIQFEGNTATWGHDWWTVGTGYQIQYSHIDKCGFTGWRQVYSGNWTGVTFENFYVDGSDTKARQFVIGGADSIFGPGFVGSSGFNRTALTGSVSAGAGPKTITVADATGAAIGNPVYIGDLANGASPTRDVSAITAIAGTTLTIGTLANAHASGEYVHLVMPHAAVELTTSHSKIDRLYISPGAGMAMHVTGGHSSTFINCELSGAPAISAGPGLYVEGATGHQFIGTVLSQVGFKAFSQFNGALVVYDSIDLTFSNTIFDNLIYSAPNLIRLGRSGAGGALLTDRIRITGSSRNNVSGSAVMLSGNAAMTAAITTISLDEARPFAYDAIDRGYRAETLPTQLVTGSTAPGTAGRLEFAKIRLPLPQSITNIVLMAITGGTALTSGQCFAALFNSAGTLIAQTADQATSWASAGLKTMALSGGPYSLAPGDYFVGFWYNGTTSPAWGRAGGVSSVMVNAGVSTPNLLFGSADTGRTTTAPGTMGAQTAQANAWWVALS